jgi:hypothetical protein
MYTVVDKKGGQVLLQIFAKIKLIATGPKSEVLTTLVKKNLKTIMVRITNLVTFILGATFFSNCL